MTFDLVLAGGTVVDGTGHPGYRADVGVSGETIAAIGDLGRAEARRAIDATGLVVAPGFIDPHTHAEGALLTDPQLAMALRQGITTLFLGIDGMSYAPLSAAGYRVYRRWLAGLLGEPPEDLDMSSVAAFRAHYHRKVALNTAYLVPFATVRLEVVGFHDVPLRGPALERARRLVGEGLEQGAVGLSTGSKYYPGPWGDTDELIALCEPVRRAGAVYMCEPRSANLDRARGGSGVAEALEVARRAGVRLHFAHYRTAPGTAGDLDAIMRLIDPARAEGLDVTFDVYPYPAGSSIAVSYLPGWAQEGGPDAILHRLGDPDDRRRIARALDDDPSIPLGQLVCSYAGRDKTLEGMSLADLAARRGATLGEALCDILRSEALAVGHVAAPPQSVALWDQVSRDCMALLARPDYMVCSDITPAGRFPHPRSYGAFPRFLGRLRRAFGGLSVEAMVHRMTDRPARRFGLPRRGRIERGAFADLVVFDADRVIDTATYDDPRRFPVGIPFVVVNGQVAVDAERPTGVLAGQAVP
ncbi:MAG TPA: amidohydrolase family protein [Methylomirabilota bacterium]|nr:amidohydrolase family protein [Methylomirabilota bacterium]